MASPLLSLLEWEPKAPYLAHPNTESYRKSFPTNAFPLAMGHWSFGPLPPFILGTAAGGILLSLADPSPWLAGLVLIGMTLIGFAAAFSIPRVPVARSEGGIEETIRGAWSALSADPVLRFGMLGSITFWTMASLVGQDIIIYGKAVLELSDDQTGLPLAAFGVGMGIGAVLAGKLSGPKVEFGLIPYGAAGISLCLFMIGLLTPQFWGTVLWMILLGVSSGFVVVPINALVQWRSPEDRRGAVIALTNTAVFAVFLRERFAREGWPTLGWVLAISLL